jgi:hypothetical protein
VLWVAVGAIVLALVVLGLVGYGVLGAGARLQKELLAAERDLRPVLEQAQALAAARARAADDRPANAG